MNSNHQLPKTVSVSDANLCIVEISELKTFNTARKQIMCIYYITIWSHTKRSHSLTLQCYIHNWLKQLKCICFQINQTFSYIKAKRTSLCRFKRTRIKIKLHNSLTLALTETLCNTHSNSQMPQYK